MCFIKNHANFNLDKFTNWIPWFAWNPPPEEFSEKKIKLCRLNCHKAIEVMNGIYLEDRRSHDLVITFKITKSNDCQQVQMFYYSQLVGRKCYSTSL